jgi:hypothetical protein
MKRNMNSSENTRPMASPARRTGPVPKSSGMPRSRNHKSRQTSAPADRKPAKNTGCNPSLVTLITT